MDVISPYASIEIARPVMLQHWRWLTFIHWRYQPALIQSLLPTPLRVDTFDGSAWVGLTPFVLSGVRLPFSPPVPWISRFPETNVRTYVRGLDGERAVWFFTLEADRLLGVLAARALYGLPYRWSSMRVRRAGERITYQSQRKWPFDAGFTDVTVEPGPAIASAELENFLTARYRLYAHRRGRMVFVQVHHEPWTLQIARLIDLRQNLVERSGVPPPEGRPVVHHSNDIAVRIGALQTFGRAPLG